MATKKLKGSATDIADYRAERRKVLRRIRDIRARGYTLPENFVPKIPKQIKPESIRNLQKYTTEYIYKHAVFTSPEGVSISGTERRAQERSEASVKAAETRAKKKQEEYYERQWQTITQDVRTNRPELAETPASEKRVFFYNVYLDFKDWKPSFWWSEQLKKLKQQDRDRGWGILTGAISALGEDAVAENLYNNQEKVIYLEQKILYASGDEYKHAMVTGEINRCLNEFNSIVYGRPLTIRESIRYTTESEQNPTYER